MQDMFSIDGRYYNVIIPENGIQRTFAVTDTDQSGRVQTGRMLRDIIGTFYNYSMTISTNNLSAEEYDELYDLISSPVESHVIIAPYGQTTLQFDAYITNGSDTLGRRLNGVNRWRELTFNFIAMAPQRV